MAISANTNVHIIFEYNGTRYYLTKVESDRRPVTSELYLKGFWNDDVKLSKPFPFETACLIRKRLTEESRILTRIVLHAGDEQFIEESTATPTQADDRVPMTYRGLLVVPGMNRDERCWFVRFPGTEFESFRGSTPEEAVDKVYARPDLVQFAEKAPAPVAVVKEVPKQVPEFKVRPGSRY